MRTEQVRETVLICLESIEGFRDFVFVKIEFSQGINKDVLIIGSF